MYYKQVGLRVGLRVSLNIILTEFPKIGSKINPKEIVWA